jgi:hypothetical protein
MPQKSFRRLNRFRIAGSASQLRFKESATRICRDDPRAIGPLYSPVNHAVGEAHHVRGKSATANVRDLPDILVVGAHLGVDLVPELRATQIVGPVRANCKHFFTTFDT